MPATLTHEGNKATDGQTKNRRGVLGSVASLFRPRLSIENEPQYEDMADHVPMLDIYDKYVVDKYGCTTAFYEVQAPTADVSSAEQLTVIQDQVCALLDSLPESILQVQVIYSTSGSYRDLVLKHAAYTSVHPLADMLRRARAEALMDAVRERRIVRSVAILTMTCAPRSPQKGLKDEFRSKAARAALPVRQITKAQCLEAIATLETARGLMDDCFGRAGMSALPMDAEAITEYFYAIFNQTRLDAGISVNYNYDSDSFNAAWICEGARFGYEWIKIGDYYHGFVSLLGKPQESTPRLIERITTDVGFRDLRVTTAIRRLDREVERAELISKRNREIRRMGEPLDILERIKAPSKREDARYAQYHIEARENVEEANQLLAELRSGEEFLAMVQVVIHFWAPSLQEFRRRRDILLSRCADMNRARATAETLGIYEVFRSSLPGSMTPMVRWNKMKGRMAADLMPFDRGFELQDDPICVLHSSTGGVVPVNLYDPGAASAPLAFISGGSGAGKSFLANHLLLGHMVDDPLVVILDIGGSYNPLVEMLGGQVLRFELGAPFCFNPLQVYGANQQDRVVAEPDTATRARLNRSLEALMTQPEHDPGGMLPQEMVRLIDRATEAAFAEAAARGARYVTPSDVMKRFQDHDDSLELAGRIKPYTRGEVYGNWFDGPTTVDLQGRIVCFDLKGIKSEPRLCRAFFPLLINYIHTLMEKNRGCRKILLMDEMWEFIANPRMAEFVVDAWKTFRKEGAVVMGITQDLAGDIAANAIVGGAIIQNTETWFLLNQGKAADNKEVARILDLTDGQMDILTSLKSSDIMRDGYPPFREMLLIRSHSRGISGRARLYADPAMRWVATTRPDERLIREQTTEHYGGGQQGLALAIEHLAKRHPWGLPAGGVTRR